MTSHCEMYQYMFLYRSVLCFFGEGTVNEIVKNTSLSFGSSISISNLLLLMGVILTKHFCVHSTCILDRNSAIR